MMPDGGIDEMVTGRGRIRPHWSGILGTISALGEDALTERVRRLDLAAAEECGGPGWRCDPLPLPLTSAEFGALEAGLVQRAELLERLLADLYGPQHLLADGTLPPALVFANPAFQRACHTPRPAPGDDASARHLHAYAADLVRGPDGAWQVVADRTNGALGIGYARESRRLLAQVLPELFRNGQVRQLRPFFEAWGEALLRLGTGGAPDGRPPLVAMLTPRSRRPALARAPGPVAGPGLCAGGAAGPHRARGPAVAEGAARAADRGRAAAPRGRGRPGPAGAAGRDRA